MKDPARKSRTRVTRSLMGVAAAVVLALIVVVALEVIAFKHNLRLDCSVQRKFSLPGPTVELLQCLDKDVSFTVYYRGGARKQYEDLFRLFSLHTSHIRYRLVHLDRHPAEARLNGITAYGQSLVECDGRRSLLRSTDESSIARVVLEAVSEGRRTVYFTEGHGETDPYQACRALLRILEWAGWKVDRIAPGQSYPLADEHAVVVIAGPQSDFAPRELEHLQRYLQRGGSAIWLAEPFIAIPRADAFLVDLDLILKPDIVVDRQHRFQGGDPLTIIIPYLSDGPITGNLKDTLVFSATRSIGLREPLQRAADARYLAMSSAAAWTTDDQAAVRRDEAVFQEDRGRPGPVPVAALINLHGDGDPATSGGKTGSLLCAGDVDFISDPFFEMQGNQEFFINALRWLSGEKNLPGVRPVVEFPHHRLSKAEGFRLFVLAVVVLPGLCLLLGITVIVLRRWRA